MFTTSHTMDEPANAESSLEAVRGRLRYALTRPLPRLTTAWRQELFVARQELFDAGEDPLFNIVTRLQFDAYGREAINTARRIGQAGWTFPMDATPGEAAALARQAETEDIDEVFSRYYDAGGYEALKASLRAKGSLNRWHPLLEQALIAYEAGHTLIVVPAMMTVMEGALAQAGGPAAWRSTRARDIASQLREKAMPQSITLAVAISVEEFVKVVFANHPFDGSRPDRLNRHWILHGRDETNWNKSDCLRLFQAICTVSD